jgi:hypothetical protein
MNKINTEEDMEKYIKNKYLVIFPDESLKLYSNLRNIEDEILVSSSTISKKMKGNDTCICEAKGTKYVFYIKRI